MPVIIIIIITLKTVSIKGCSARKQGFYLETSRKILRGPDAHVFSRYSSLIKSINFKHDSQSFHYFIVFRLIICPAVDVDLAN